ncbi:MAG: hypothetical protein A2096_03155 [Spirochaetes bacterium GWF1_41_5]|nr:MAG: hypothetical protein A2096_03155 [Spirochaetes bacterium GWF1_41_5]HBE03177.1 hypothetical protein [Spirochaetia bacterium]
MAQCILTPAAGKRLIGRALAVHPAVIKALDSGTIVIIAGTTNGYAAEEILKKSGQEKEFSRSHFIRGVTMPPDKKTTENGRLPDESEFPGDVIIKNGRLIKGKTIFDLADDLKKGDVILKGANCVNLAQKKAGILIGHPRGGTIAAAVPALIGRRVRIIIPAGLEKRVSDDIDKIAGLLNSPESSGPRLFPAPGEIFTEIDAVKLLSGADACLTAAGGVCGAEGAVWLFLTGTSEQVENARNIINEISGEPRFALP